MSLGGPNPPLSVLLSWPPPNYVDPVTQGPALKIINIVSLVLGSCTVAARIYARFVLTKAAGVDDAFIVLGLAFGIAFSALTIVATDDLGVGRHIWDVLPSNGAAIRLNLFAMQWCYTLSMTCIRISILLLYKRLSGAFTSRFFRASCVGIVYNVVYAISFFITLLVQCHPIKAYWLSYDRTWAAEHPHHCSSMERTSLPVFAALSVVGDVYSTVLPLTLVSSLKLPLRRKLSLYALFALGFVVAGAGIVRTWFVYETANKTYDTTWWMSPAFFWITFEMYLALLCACAPALKPIFKRHLIVPIRQYSAQSARRHTHQDQDEAGVFESNPDSTPSNNDGKKMSWLSIEKRNADDLSSTMEGSLPYRAASSPSPSSGRDACRSPSQSHTETSGVQEITWTSLLNK